MTNISAPQTLDGAVANSAVDAQLNESSTRCLDLRKLTRHFVVIGSLCAVSAFRPDTTSARPSAEIERHSAGEILFTSSAPQGKSDIYSVRSDGSGLRKISRQPVNCLPAAWRFDKKKIVMAIYTKLGVAQKRDVWRSHLTIMDARTGAIRNIAIAGHPNLQASNPSFTPSGREVIFTGMVRPRFANLYRVRVDGSHLQQLTKTEYAENARYSKDAKTIVFSAFGKRQQDIWVMNAQGKNARQLTRNAGNNQSPVFSPDGKKIAFVSLRNRRYQIHAMNADGSDQKQLTSTRENNFFPAFSPDGRQIAFMRRSGKIEQIYVMNADGANQRRVTSLKNGCAYPDWK